MKKSQILGLSVATAASVAGSIALVMPQTASAAVTCGSAITAATATQNCSGSGGYTADNVNFTGSKGVAMTVSDQTSDFSACGWHVSGSKSFGMTTSLTTMSIVTGTGATVTSGVGCQ